MCSRRNADKAISAWTSRSISVLMAVTCVFVPGVSSSAQETAGAPSAGLPKMSTAADPVFEVATIKPSRLGGDYPSIETHSRSLSVTNASVLDLIKWAYRMRDEQIKGGPPWMTEMKFDIVGQPDIPGQPSPDQDRLTLRKLLVERFHLVVHEAQDVSSVYALALGDGQPRMVPSNPPDGHIGIYPRKLDNGTAAVQFAFTTMPDFLYVLMNSVRDHQIIDETGLKGEYNFTLVLPSTALEENADPGDVTAAFFKAVQSIGLQLRRKKAPIKVIVIDRLETPTPN
jgi:uncharacterized protein (TIGR03435 family)